MMRQKKLTVNTAPSLLRQLSTAPVNGFQLRDYQEDAIKAVHGAIARGINRPAIVLATGGGKTVVFSKLIPQLKPLVPTQGTKTLVLAHKQELVYQAASKISHINPDLKVQIDMHKLTPDEDADVIVGSVPTLVRLTRLTKYAPVEFKTIILDECHHATANSWTKILKYFGADTKDSPMHVIGFTATMERADGGSLGQSFDEIVYERGIVEMVKNKELVDVKFSTLDTHVDFSQVRTRNKDFEVKSLSEVMNTESVNSIISATYLRLREEFNFKSTLIFCVDIAHCKTLCGVLQSQGISAQYVTGETVNHERVAILEDFKNGRIEVLCNVLVFTEGTDIPNIDSLILARPTKSRPLLVQMIGRGLRLHEGKTHCHIVDVAGIKSVGIESVPTLFGAPESEKWRSSRGGKSYEELLDLDTRLMSKLQIKEEKRKREEEMIKQRLSDVELRKKALDFSFSTIDGFALLLSKDMSKFQSDSSVNETIRRSSLNWVRLEYDVWGLPLTMTDNFFTITRIREDGESVKFGLDLNCLASPAQREASGYKCPNWRKISQMMTPTTQLSEVISRAEISRRSYGNANDALWEANGNSRFATTQQVNYVKQKLKNKAEKLYSELPSKTIESLLRKNLNDFSMNRIKDLIFAMRYSINSLWVLWELQKMLGYNDKNKRAIEKAAKDEKMDSFINPTTTVESTVGSENDRGEV